MVDAMLFLQTDDKDLPAQMMKGMTEVQLYLHQMVQTSQVRFHSSPDMLYSTVCYLCTAVLLVKGVLRQAVDGRRTDWQK